MILPEEENQSVGDIYSVTSSDGGAKTPPPLPPLSIVSFCRLGDLDITRGASSFIQKEKPIDQTTSGCL